MSRLSFIVVLCLAGTVAAESPDVTPEQREFFEKSVRPLLATHCHQCHGPDKQKGELRLDSRAAMLAGGQTGPAIVPGQPEKSELILAVSYDPLGYQMPPTGKLKPEQIEALTKWVNVGAPWPGREASLQTPLKPKEFDLNERAKHWSFQPVKHPAVPTVHLTHWPRNPIDSFILARLEEEKLQPAEEADRRTWLRRVTYDLIGLPPTAKEVQQFLSDPSDQAYAKVVDQLLASPAYGERWGRHWLDLVRFAETSGHEFDYEIEGAAPYRDYVVRALNADLPYDQFLLEHVAGDLLPSPRRHPARGYNESIIGTGFYWFGQGKHSPVDLLAEECDSIDNQIDVLGKTFLGLTIACARCHDHKFDPITAADYYAMAGYLQSSRRQRAFLDPPEPARKLTLQLQPLQAKRGELLSQVAARQFALSAAQVEDVFNSTKEAAKKDLMHPFHPWAVLSELDDVEEFARARVDLKRRLNLLSRKTFLGEEFADFSAASFDQWFKTGPAFHQGAISSVQLAPSENEVQLLPPETVHSGTMSGCLQGVVRSPTFPIKHRYVHYRAHRVGGLAHSEHKNKAGQVHLIVDGFHFIRNPLYGHLTISVRQEDSFRWYQQDVGKFLGSKAYIEIQDEDDGYVVIDRIVFSDEDRPPDAPSQLVLAMLNDPLLNSPEQLRESYCKVLNESLKQWQSGRWSTTKQGRDRVQLLNALFKSAPKLLSLSPTEQATLTALQTKARQLEEAFPMPMRAIAMADGTGEDAHLLIRGNHKKPGEPVPRRFLEVFDETSESSAKAPSTMEGSGRLDLAHRMADPQNPLTARVLVNRLWLHHFGRGLVATPDDFGHMGQPPSHPLLLDWLATELVRSEWSIKRMHRLMVLSSTYRLSSELNVAPRLEVSIGQQVPVGAERIDPENKLLHHVPVCRLEGEIIRDAILALSGRLSRRMEGPSVLPYLTPFMEGRGRPSQSGPLDGDGRRSLYVNVRRNFLTPMFLAFDYPTPFTTIGRRSVSNVPAQALTMMNNPFVVQQARIWAERVLAEDHKTPRDCIRRLYEMAFTRPPTEAELAAGLNFLTAQGQEYSGPDDPRTWADYCHVLMNVKEFVFIN